MTCSEIEERYDELLSLDDRIERKGKNNPYTSMNGHMFSFIAKPEGDKESFLAIRLSKEAQEKFMKDYNTGPVIQYGTTMQGYVEIPSTILADTKKVYTYLKQSYDYISSLPPKPMKNKK